MAKDKYYKIKLDVKAKAPEIKTASIKLEALGKEPQKEFEETRSDNKGKSAWLMPSGSIFWASKELEINNAKRIIFKEGAVAKKVKPKKKPKAKGKTKAKAKKKKK